MRLFIKIVIAITVLIGIAVLLVASWYFYETSKDVLVEIDSRYSELKEVNLVTDTARNHEELRIYHDMELIAQDSDTTRITISRPFDSELTKMPVLIVLGGLETGRKSLGYIPHHGNNVLVSYQYPFKPSYFDDGAYFTGFLHIREAILKTPAQVCLALRWIREQAWADQDRIILLGFSLGAMVLPASQRLAQFQGVKIRASALCYGVVDYDELIYYNFRDRFPGVNPITSSIGAALIRPIEPRFHLEDLKGEFLVVNGKFDQRIPFAKALEFQALVPEPKTIINLDEGHMHPRKPELTMKLVLISREWLLERGLANP